MNRLLVLNSNESRWNFKEPTLFIDDNCCKIERKKVWSKMDFKIAKPYVVDSKKKDEDLNYVYSLFFQLIKEISIILNTVHKLEYPERFWQILVGPWLENYLTVLFNRYNKIKNAIQNYDLSGVNLINTENKYLTVKDTITFSQASMNQYWNEVLYSMMLETFKSDIKINYINRDDGLYYFQSNNKVNLKKSLLHHIKNNLFSILKHFKKDNDAFIINSYLPFFEEMKLNLNLKQIPQIWRSPEIKYPSIDITLRKKILISHENYGEFENFARLHIPFSIPICFLEGFEKLTNIVSNLSWPKKPKFIFTSNNHDYDEAFKLWTVQKREENVPYFIGQHGVSSLIGNHLHYKVRSPDKFVEWGESGWGKNQNGFNLKLVGQKFKHNNDGNLLIMVAPYSTARKIWDNLDIKSKLNEDWLRKLISNLPKKILRNTILRLHGSYKIFSFTYYENLKKDFPEIKYDFYEKKLKKLYSESRLVVHCYDSSGILETMPFNIPTMCFWPDTFGHIEHEYKQYYELLIEAKILAKNPEQLASFIISNWSNTDKWMGEPILKQNVKKFLYKFSNFPPKYATKKLAQHLLNITHQHNK